MTAPVWVVNSAHRTCPVCSGDGVVRFRHMDPTVRTIRPRSMPCPHCQFPGLPLLYAPRRTA